jgi:pimeloyl-ACP methyl ester carboxylesterase
MRSSELNFINLKKRAWNLSMLFFLFCISSCSSLYYQPDRILYSRPQQFNHAKAIQEFDFLSTDRKTKLKGWMITPYGKSKGTIVQFHGNAENMSSHVHFIIWLLKEGYTIWTWDYRGYGGSEGTPDPNGVIEDGVAALDFAYQNRQGQHFIVWGQSIGGAIAPRSILKFEHRNKIDLLILDSTFSSYKTVARQLFAKQWYLWPFQWVAWLLASDAGESSNSLRSFQGRSLVLHDHLDPVIDFESGKEVYRLLTGRKELWELNEGTHLGSISDQNPEQQKRMTALLNSL